jgi:hypothetical protein
MTTSYLNAVPTSVRVEVWDRCRAVRQILDGVLIGDVDVSTDLLAHLAGVLTTGATRLRLAADGPQRSRRDE